MDDPMDADFDTLIPLEFIIPQLPPFQISELVQRQICELPDPLADCIFPLTYWQALQTHPITPMFLSYNGKVAALTWLTEPLLLHKPMLARYWYREDVMGFIRNQFEHLLCWSFVATDMVSAMSVIHGWEDDYRVFCPWYLFLCCNPTSVGRDVDAKPGHKCYGFSVTQALRFIQASGVPKVGVGRSKSDFDCSELYPLPPFGEASRISQRVSGVRPIETLEEAILELRFRPVACDLVCYSQLAKDAEIYGFKVYTGPFNQRSGMIGYHAVIMVDVTLIDGRWVAICKMCNGVDAAVQGYVYVCLSTMYTFVGCIDESRRFIRPSSRPQRLLTNFVVLEMHENQKGEKKQDEKKPDERDPENPKERKLKEPCSVAGMYMTGSSSSSVSVAGEGSTSSSVSVTGPVSSCSSVSVLDPGSTSSFVSVAGPVSGSSFVSVAGPVSTSGSSSVAGLDEKKPDEKDEKKPCSVVGDMSGSSSSTVSVAGAGSTSRSVSVTGPVSSCSSVSVVDSGSTSRFVSVAGQVSGSNSVSVAGPVSTSDSSSVAGMNQYKTISLERADPKTEPSKLTRACNTQKHIDLDDVGKQMKDELDVFPEEAVIPEAKCIKGLRAVSGEVYPDPVRMVSIGRKVEKDLLADPEDSEGSLLLSSEFCGGTDITNTRKAKASALLLEERIAKRIRNDAFKVEDECAFDVTAECALDALNVAASLEKEVDDASKVEGSALEKKVAALKRRVDMAIIPAAKKADIRAKITLLQALKKESG